MPFRLALRRSGAMSSMRAAGQSFSESVRTFSFGKFFEEKYFWQRANVGPFFLLLFCTPTIYRSFKDFYWTRELRKLNTEEIISDRYEWLRLEMLRDEVEATVLRRVPADGIAALELGASTPR
mmetsp:Transcript_92467/g.261212  ORF Transcript_92467/g.261212 Transcript_92467/m.261212 type:complete len:123 (+) Transcript_92467:118-486(+)